MHRDRDQLKTLLRLLDTGEKTPHGSNVLTGCPVCGAPKAWWCSNKYLYCKTCQRLTREELDARLQDQWQRLPIAVGYAEWWVWGGAWHHCTTFADVAFVASSIESWSAACAVTQERAAVLLWWLPTPVPDMRDAYYVISDNVDVPANRYVNNAVAALSGAIPNQTLWTKDINEQCRRVRQRDWILGTRTVAPEPVGREAYDLDRVREYMEMEQRNAHEARLKGDKVQALHSVQWAERYRRDIAWRRSRWHQLWQSGYDPIGDTISDTAKKK